MPVAAGYKRGFGMPSLSVHSAINRWFRSVSCRPSSKLCGTVWVKSPFNGWASNATRMLAPLRHASQPELAWRCGVMTTSNLSRRNNLPNFVNRPYRAAPPPDLSQVCTPLKKGWPLNNVSLPFRTHMCNSSSGWVRCQSSQSAEARMASPMKAV